MKNVYLEKFINFYRDLSMGKFFAPLLLAMLIWPSYDLTKLIKYPYKPTYIPTLTAPGQSLIFPYDSKVDYIRLKSKDLSILKSSKLYLSGIDINESSNVYLHGAWPFQKISFPLNLFAHSTLYFFKTLIPVNQRKIDVKNRLRLPSSVWKRVNDRHKDQKALDSRVSQKILSTYSRPLKHNCMKSPLNSVSVSKFGSSRTLPNGKSYRHTGLDLRARSPKPIRNMLSGVVKYASHMVVPGNNIIIDHGQGLFSRYMHLSKFKTEPGKFVSQSSVIGLTGGTGRAEAPHLHWEVIWKNNRINPIFLKEKINQYCYSM